MESVAPASAAQSVASVIENTRIARDTYRLRLAAPAMAQAIRPGQFLMVRPGPRGSSDPLLGRPLALYDVVRDQAGQAIAIDVVYLVIGRGTAALAERGPGDDVTIWGPLGNGFGRPPSGSVLFVAGGIGQTPFLALGRSWLGTASYGADDSIGVADSVTLLYGARTADLFAGLDDFRAGGIEVELATDDGSLGHHGYVTELVTRRLERGRPPSLIVGCGPVPMIAALARIAREARIDCQVSLENHMACGIGACFSCVAPMIASDGSTDLRRVCVDGPVVSAHAVAWDQMT